MNRIFGLLVLCLAACPSEPYAPCETKDDCDPLIADGCFTPSSGEGFCSTVCRVTEDCPSLPDGSRPTCKKISSTLRVCSL